MSLGSSPFVTRRVSFISSEWDGAREEWEGAYAWEEAHALPEEEEENLYYGDYPLFGCFCSS